MSESAEMGGESFAVAIVGMAGRFPGADDLATFWRNLRDGVESISHFSDAELLALGVDPALLARPDFVRAAPLLAGADRFDAAFFGYTPREAALIDPQQRMFLECSWAALEHAGYASQPAGCTTAVYAGTGLSTYLLFNLLGNPAIDQDDESFAVMIGNDKDFLSTRVSYHCNLTGPSVDVQTGCSTALVAVHLACQGLLAYQCDLALAGGVAVQLPQRAGYLYRAGDIRSPDGHCRAFDARAQGTVFGSGVGAVVLKRLDDAIRDRDHIHAVIRGSAINNDGAARLGYTAPSVAGQSEVITQAHALAGVSADTIGYVEAHGTATALGDPAEVAALTQAFRTTSERNGFCMLGSVKTNIGHLDAAAGIAGLLKTVLALQHGQIPPSLHYSQPNPQIDFAATPFTVCDRLTDWAPGSQVRRAGVSSFGIGGTNAHVVLEEAPGRITDPAQEWQVLLLSARTPSALDTATDALAAALRDQPDGNLADAAFTLAVGRPALAERRVLVCRDRADALERLAVGETLTASRVGGRPTVAFMFPGQGSQYPGMGSELYQHEPVFRAAVDQCTVLLRPHLGLDIRTAMFEAASPDAGLLNQTRYAQPALFVVEYALAQLWQSWGVQPRALIGHSVGEYVAACLAGVFRLEDALGLVAARGRLMQECVPGAMLAVPLAEQALRPLLPSGLALAAVNGPQHCAVAGPPEALAQFAKQLAQQGLTCRPLQTSHAFHSAMMDPILEPFARLVGQVRRAAPQLPYLSNVSGSWITAQQASDPHYWATHLRQTVRFGDGLAALLDAPDAVLLEVGPGTTLSALARQQGRAARAITASLRHPQDPQPERAALRTALGRLWLAGVELAWPQVYAHEQRGRVALPTYPFERQRCWIDPAPPRQPAQAAPGKRPDLSAWFATPSWTRAALPAAPADGAVLAGTWLVLLDRHGVGAALAERLTQAGGTVVQVAPGQRFERLAEASYTLDPQQPSAYAALLEDLARCDRLPQAVIHPWSLAPDTPQPDGLEAFQQAQQHGFYSLLFLAQALAYTLGERPCRLWALTSHLHAIESQDAAHPAQAPLQAIATVVPQECETLRCHLLDLALPTGGDLGGLASQIMAELASPQPPPLVAYRSRQRWLPTFAPLRLEPPARAARPLRSGGVYLIVGGLGGIGMQLAEELARTAQARLVLTARAAFPPRSAWQLWLTMYPEQNSISTQIRRLQAIEQAGGAVLVCSADVADEAAMRGVVEQAQAHFGALHGVIHAAGLAGEQVLSRLTETDQAACERQFHARVAGLYTLERVLRGIPIDFCLLCSSNSAVLGGLGALAYAAAHYFMDSFAQQRAAAGEPWISVNWDAWLLPEQPGRGPRTSLDTYALTPAEGAAAFQRVLAAAPSGQVVVSAGDLAQRLAAWSAPSPASGMPAQPRPALDTPYAAPTSAVEQTIAAAWQETLGIAQVGLHDNFFDLGGTSLTALRVVARLERALQISIPMVQLFEAPTVSALARLLGGQAGPERPDGLLRGEQRRARHQL